MNFDFSDDQEQLRDAVRRFVEKGYGFERRRQIEREGGFSREAWDELADLGLCGLLVPEADGGMGMGPVEAMVVMEELGRGIVLEPLAQSFIAGALLAGHADEAIRDEWLPRLAGGQALVALAWQERAGRYRPDRIETRATTGGNGVTLDGTKSLVPAGDQADAFIVSATDGSRIGLYLVEAKSKGTAVTGYATQDGSRAAELVLQGANARPITQDGLQALEHGIDIGIAATCAEAVGVMDQMLAVTVDYMNTRKQFGVPIASFQALRHRVADMKMQLELARSMSYYASLKLDSPSTERRQAVARAKVQLGQSMRLVRQEAVQLHGGIGVTDEYIASHYFRKLTQMEMLWGDSFFHLGEVSARMQDTAGVFA